MEKLFKSENCIKIVAMILVAVMWVGVMLGLYGLAISGTDAAPTNAKVDVEVNGGIANDDDTPDQTIIEEEEVETRVLLNDESGSMKSTNNWATDYHTTLPFCDYLGQTNGNSQICTNIERVLSMGVKELGVITDMESYPAEDLEAFEGKNYSDVELIFYVSEEVNYKHVDTYKKLFSEVLDKESSTFIIVYTDGSKTVVFDNYNKNEPEEETVTVETEIDSNNIKINVEANAGNQGISNIVLAAILMILFTVIMALIEVILVISMRGHSQKEVVVTTAPVPAPGGIKEALKCPTALDGSASVSHIYKKMVEWARNENVDKVYRFADRVEILSLDEAGNQNTSGNTHGWECLKKMFDDGIKEITIVSDMDFNDYQVTNISFDAITFVIPDGGQHNKSTLERVAAMAKTYKVITI